MRRAVIACDDGVVRKLSGGLTLVACVLWSLGEGPLLVGHLPVHVDGLDATSQITFLIKTLMSRATIVDAVLLDALTIAGFNVVSPASVYEKTGIPVIILYKRRPRWGRIYSALRSHFEDYDLRLRVVGLLRDVITVRTSRGLLYAVLWGISVRDAARIIESYQLYARIPEPLRMAHLYASALSRVLIQE